MLKLKRVSSAGRTYLAIEMTVGRQIGSSLGLVLCRRNHVSYFAPLSRVPTRETLPVGYTRNSVSAFSSVSGGHDTFNQPPIPQRSLLRRLLSFCAIGVFFTTAGFAMAAAPAVPALNNLLSPPTDADTLSMFEPLDESTAKIERYIQDHPIAQELRKNPAFIESRPHMKIPEEIRSHNLTGGVLSGPGKVWVPPLSFAEVGGKSITVLYFLGPDMCGHPGIVHGGCLATILDEGLARCCFQALPNKVGMTANLNINYRAPVPANTYLCLRATTTKTEGRKAWVEGRLESATIGQEEPTIFCEATGLFIEPKQAATMARLYPAAAA